MQNEIKNEEKKNLHQRDEENKESFERMKITPLIIKGSNW